MKFTVFYDQTNSVNIQVDAKNEQEAVEKANKIYKRRAYVPTAYVQDGWVCLEDGEDK